MIVEMREYTLHAGTVPAYFKLYEEEGLEIQRTILGRLIGYYATEVGPAVNQVVHLWAYDSFDDRIERRRALAADPDWQAYLKKMRPMLAAQTNRLLTPAPFFAAELAP